MTPRDIELATIAAWPAAVTEHYDGWRYLASGGVTGRVNAVWPLDWTGASLDAAISHAERWYAQRNLPARFKLTDGAVAPPDLADALRRRSYEAVSPTLVMTAPLRPAPIQDGPHVAGAMPPAFDVVLRQTAKDEAEYEERLSIALRAPAPAAFATLDLDRRTAAIGMTAGTADLAGIFLMRTAPEARRQGLARRILRALLSSAAARGARTAFLQVEADNAPAIRLYESEGFATLSTYRFWRKPQP
jgi:ribosomal protein S18 acetylase RimI-like enzyme